MHAAHAAFAEVGLSEERKTRADRQKKEKEGNDLCISGFAKWLDKDTVMHARRVYGEEGRLLLGLKKLPQVLPKQRIDDEEGHDVEAEQAYLVLNINTYQCRYLIFFF